MSIIQISNLTFTHEGASVPLFENINLHLDTNWKLGLIGRNGRGKTTFLQLLLGRFQYRGSISTAAVFDYFPYDLPCRQELTLNILHKLCPACQDWEFRRELALIELDEELLLRPLNTLSPGEEVKVILAAMFLRKQQFLLIDEPTNHLDVKGRQIVAAYLRKKTGFILVSHDRSFLDGCVDHILAMNKTGIEIQQGNFSSWWMNKQRQEEFELSCNRRLTKEVVRLQKAAALNSLWSEKVEQSKFGKSKSGLKPDRGYIGHKAAKMMKRSLSIQNRKEKAVTEKMQLLHDLEGQEKLKLWPLLFHSQQLLSLADVKIFYDQQRICGPLSFTLAQGERVAVTGKNGCGKSTLLKLICREVLEYSGTCHIPSQLKISYVPQDTSHLQGFLCDYAKAAGIEESRFKTILRKLDFDRSTLNKDMAKFSAGQKKKFSWHAAYVSGRICMYGTNHSILLTYIHGCKLKNFSVKANLR